MVIGDNIYALVASQADDGVQIIDITNPTTPVALSAISDVGGNDIALNDVVDITTILINDRTYALVPSPSDNGVQIIDIGITFQPYILDSTMLALTITVSDSLSITDALPGLDLNQITTSDSLSITDRFNAVIPPTRVTTDFPSITDNISSMISLSSSDSVDPILSITSPTNASALTSGEEYSLSSANDITTISIGDNTYALVAAFSSSAVQIIDITNPTSPRPTAVIIDNDTLALDGATVITTITINDTLYAIVASQTESGVQIINVTDPTSPTATAAIFHGVDYSLDNPNGISTALINDRTYALVTSVSGVQIIDITTPTIPAPAYIIINGTDFPELGDVNGITTVSVGANTYALVTSQDGDGGSVQIIDITNPARPVTTAAIIDNATLALDDPQGITTILIDDKPYALVASQTESGVQIINITNPLLPNATAAIFNGDTFSALVGANAISAVTIHDRTYALVASGDGAVQIIDITDPTYPAPIAAIFDGEDFTTLAGAFGIATMIIGNNVYALVASVTDDGVQIIDTGISLSPQVSDSAVLSSRISSLDSLHITDDTILANSFYRVTSDSLSITDDTSGIISFLPSDSVDTFLRINAPSFASSITNGTDYPALSNARGITIVTINDTLYALVASLADDGIQIVNITDPTNPASVAHITDEGTRELDGAIDITTIFINDKPYALVASLVDNGVQIINITDPTTPVAIANLTDTTDYLLDSAISITTIVIDDKPYALVASRDENGIQIIDITNPAMPDPVFSILDGDGYVLGGAFDITSIVIDGTPYALVASRDDDAIQIINITDPTDPDATATISNGGGYLLDGINGITTATVGANTYALVTAGEDNGVTIIDITDPTDPDFTAAISDGDAFPALDGAIGITTIPVGTSTFALVASQTDNAVTIIDITNPSNPLFISNITDTPNHILDGAYDITAVTVGDNTYALVTSLNDNGVQIIDIGITLQPYPFDSVAFVLSQSVLATDSVSITDDTSEMSQYQLVSSDSLSITDYTSRVDNQPIITSDSLHITDDTSEMSQLTTSDSLGGTALSITSPSHVSAISDDDSTELVGASGITTIHIGENTYALVASITDDGVTIIDITNPVAPDTIAILSDGVGDYTGLDGAFEVDTITISDTHYALVASFNDNSVTIINITTPDDPRFVSAIFDGTDFPALGGAADVVTIFINDTPYALVASTIDNSVTILDLTDPVHPAEADRIVDGEEENFDKLRGAASISTITIGSKIYALVTASVSNSVTIIDITNPANIIFTASVSHEVDNYELFIPVDITTVLINDETYALVASEESGVQIINITNPLLPNATATIIDDDDNTALASPARITTASIGANTYALVTSAVDDGVQIIDITDPAHPDPVSFIIDNAEERELDNARGITTVTIDGTLYVLVAAFLDNGVQIIDIGITLQSQLSDSVVLVSSVSAPGISVTDSLYIIDTIDIGYPPLTTFDSLSITDDTSEMSIAPIFTSDSLYITDTITTLITEMSESQLLPSDSVDTFTSITNSSFVSALDDNGTLALDRPFGITTILIDDKPYALVAAQDDNGVQIINITDPTVLDPIYAITDGEDFPELGGARGITTIVIDDTPYALVASFIDDAVQIIDLTDPAMPDAIANLTDTTNLALDGASSITTVLINDKPYALVASVTDNGVQIINITDPTTPIGTASIFDNSTLALDDARAITTVFINDKPYALVAAQGDNGVQIIDITDPVNPVATANILDNATLALGGATGITTILINDDTFALVTSLDDNGVQIINITNPAMPTPVVAISDGGDYTLDSAFGITTVTIGDNTFALVAARGDDGVQIIDVTNPTNPTPVSTITDIVGGTTELRGATDITTVTIDGTIYALVASTRDDGVQMIDIGISLQPYVFDSVVLDPSISVPPSSLTTSDSVDTFVSITDPTPVSALDNNATLALDRASRIATILIDDKPYALVTSGDDDGVQIINITNPTILAPVSAITDGEDFPALGGAFGITTIVIDDTPYALVSSISDDAVQIIDVTDPVHPVATANLTDTANYSLNGARDITTIVIDDKPYALVASQSDHGVQIINITNPAILAPVSAIFDNDTLALRGAYGITTVFINDKPYALVASQSDGGVQIINITNPAMPDPIAAIHDNATLALDDAQSITTVTIGTDTFALVTSSVDDGVQIINITNPAMPAPVYAIVDEEGEFTALNNPSDITTVTVGANTFALVTARDDDGVVIIDISNPTNPTTVSIITDSDGIDLELDGAHGITTVTIDGTIYALVASIKDDGVQVIDIGISLQPYPFDSAVLVSGMGSQGITATDSLSITDDISDMSRSQLPTSDSIPISDVVALVATVSIAHTLTISDLPSITDDSSDMRQSQLSTSDSIQISDSAVLDPSITVSHSLSLSDSLSITDDESLATLLPIITSDSIGGAILSITDPSHVSAISDDDSTELVGASGITTIHIGENTYALVASITDDGVTIIDITDPVAPDAIAILSNGVGDYTGLDGAFEVDTITISDTHYALVASFNDDSVTIINITTPDDPRFVSAIFDGTDFPELGGAADVVTIFINDTPYALVASTNDNSVTILDLTDPVHPTEADRIVDGVGDFDKLRDASSISTITIGSKIYAVVAASVSNSVTIIDITDPTDIIFTASVSNGVDYSLFIPVDITTVLINDDTFALVASEESGVQIINITNPLLPNATATIIDDDDNTALASPARITTASIGENTYALVTSAVDDGVQIIDITNPARPTPVSFIIDNSEERELDNARGITTVTIDGTLYVLVAAFLDNGVQIIDIGITSQSPTLDSVVLDPAISVIDSPVIEDDLSYSDLPPVTFSDSIDTLAVAGTPSSVSNITNGRGGFSALDGPSRVTTVTLGDNTYALVTASDSNGVQIIDITNPAMPVATAALFDGVDHPTLGGASGIATATIGSSIYALVASFADAGIQIIDITNYTDSTRLSTSPTSVSNITNNENGFDELAGVTGITTVKIGEGTFALALSSTDDSVTIIDITDPTAPTEAFAITDGSTFPVLNSPTGIATISINDDTFALVTSQLDHGVQIINITTPTSPTSASTITDNDTLALRGANDIATILINDKPYALVASVADNGVQIIDITDPTAPDPIATLTNGTDYPELGGPTRISTVSVDTITYALVVSRSASLNPNQDDDGIQIIDITNPASPAPVYDRIYDTTRQSATNSLDIATAIIDGTAYAIATSSRDDTIQIIDTGLGLRSEFTDSAVLITPISVSDNLEITDSSSRVYFTSDVAHIPASPVSAIFDNATLALAGASSITTVTISDNHYALVASQSNEGVQIINITDPTNHSFTASIANGAGGFSKLGTLSDITTTTIGDRIYALVVSFSGSAVTIIDITNPAAPTHVTTISNGGGYTLATASAITTVSIDGTPYALVTSFSPGSVQIIDITNPASPVATSNIVDNGELTALGGAEGITTTTIGNNIYALVASSGDDGVQIINVTDPTDPTATANIVDNSENRRLDGAIDITAITINDKHYALISSSVDDGVQIIDITDPTSPDPITAIIQGEDYILDGTRGITAVTIGSKAYAIATSFDGDSAQIINITNPASPTPVFPILTNGADYTLDGARGVTTITIDDIIYALVASEGSHGVQIIDTGISLEPRPTLVASRVDESHITLIFDRPVDTTGADYRFASTNSLADTPSGSGTSTILISIGERVNHGDSITLTILDTLTSTLRGTLSLDVQNRNQTIPSAERIFLSGIDDTVSIRDTNSTVSEIHYSASSLNATLVYSPTLNPGTGPITNRQITVTSSDIAGGDVKLTLQPSTTISGLDLTRIINLPEDLGVSCNVNFTSTNIRDNPDSCIDVGQTNRVLSLSSPAEIVLSNQEGNTPWYANNSTVSASAVQITTECAVDDRFGIVTVYSVNRQFTSDPEINECYTSEGNDLVIWTNHFTVYGSSPMLRSGGGSGGGSSGESTPPSFTTSFDPGTSTISIGDTGIAPEPSVTNYILNDPVLVSTGESIPISLTMYENISWESIAHVEICLNKQTSNNQICDSDTKIIWDKNTDDLEIIDPSNLIRTASLDISETNSNVATWNYDITFDGIMDTSDMQIYAWDNRRNALTFTVENAINVVLGAATSTSDTSSDTRDTTSGTTSSDTRGGTSGGTSGGTGSGGSGGSGDGIISDTNNPPRTFCSAGELLLNDGSCMDPEPGTFTCSDEEVMVYDGTCTASDTILDSDISLDFDSQSDIIKRWAGYSELSATDYELTSSLGIETDSDVYLPKWIKSHLGELTINNHITVDQLKSVVAYMAEIPK